MAAILADDIFKSISIQISPNFAPKGPVDNNPALVWIMSWRQIVDNPLSETMLTRPTDAYIRLQGEMSQCVVAIS